ncbi:hypothetical protein RE0356_09430 [Prescottella equi]|nr:hypothetical protein RE0346_09730 [Prescottella equi]BCN82302.1 hypothetical protein RE0356_09430 [Prescottella equi]
MTWSVYRGRGQLLAFVLAFVNETGPARDVEMRLQGVAVGGRSGSRDWTAKRPLMEQGDAVTSATPDGDRLEQTVDRLPP